MTTLTVAHNSLKITETLKTKVAQITADEKSIILESHPEIVIPLNGRKAGELGLAVGNEIIIEPASDAYTLKFQETKASTPRPRPVERVGGCAPGTTLSNTF